MFRRASFSPSPLDIRPTGYRIFLYALLFHRHLSTLHEAGLRQRRERVNDRESALLFHCQLSTLHEAGLRQRRERVNDQESVAPLSQPRQGKPGFTERWRERRAFETADGGEIINGSHHWCFTGLPLSFHITLRHSIAVAYVVLLKLIV